MSRRALILDGLWYTLCPSFSHLSISRPALSQPRARTFKRRTSLAVRNAPVTPRRCFSGSTHNNEDGGIVGSKSAPHNPRQTPGPDIEVQSHSEEHVELSGDANRAEKESEIEVDGPEPWRKTTKVYKDLEGKSISELEALLQKPKTLNIRATTPVLRALIRDHHVQPRARHYKALILANVDSVRGSPDAVRGLLSEMEENGIAADSGTLHAALQVLAVHPDFLLRREVLHKLRDRWLPLSPQGWHFVVAGLLREHQFELALEQITSMERKDIPIENWLHSMIIYQLCDVQEFDEVYRLMQARVQQGHDITLALWTHVLNTAIQAQHYVTTRYVWQRMVDLGYLHPSEDSCSDVLALATRLGDVEQANSVFRFLTENNKTPRLQDFEHLMEVHVKAGDLSTAFDVLCSMHEIGIAPEEGSTKPILTYMIQSKVDPREAWQMLKHLKNANRNIPLFAVQVIAEVCEHCAHDDASVVDDAVGFYKELYTLCPGGANVQVYNTLIRMCRIARNREAGMFLVKEMASLRVVPNATTFEGIVLMCLDAGNYQSAYMYFQDMLKRDATISSEARKEVQELCGKSVNEFALRLQYHPQIKTESPVEAQPKEGSLEQEGGSSVEKRLADAESVTKKKNVSAAIDRRQRERQRLAITQNLKLGRTDLVRAARRAYNLDRRRRKRQRLATERWLRCVAAMEEGDALEGDGLDSDRGVTKPTE